MNEPELNKPKTTKINSQRGGVSRIWRLATKELRETLRDRRTIVTLVLMPLLVYPILSLVFQNFLVSSLGNLPGNEEPGFTMAFTSNLTEQESTVFLFQISEQISNYEKQFAKADADPEAALEENDLEYRIVDQQSATGPAISSNNWSYLDSKKKDELAQLIAQGDADVGIHFEFQKMPPRISDFKVVEREDSVSQKAGQYVRQKFGLLNEMTAGRVLKARGAKLPLSRPVIRKIEFKDNAPAGGTIASLIPLALVLMTITGAVYPAIDLTAGERERGTLETLMAAPVPRMGILFAKFIAVVTVAVLTAILNLIGMAIVMWVFQLDTMLPGGGLSFGIIFKVFLLLVLFACFFAACLLMVTSFARSFKEAQAYLVPIILLSLGPGLLAMSPSVSLAGLTAVTPMMNLLVMALSLIHI